MTGFPPDALDFLAALKADNTREWFQANRSAYDAAITAPAAAFSEAMAAALERLTGARHTAKIFRLHRDVRFSKDKTPYNTHVRMAFTPVEGPSARPAWFWSLETDHLVLGAGVFAYAKGDLDRWRARVDGAEGEALAGLLAPLEDDGVRLNDPDLKRTPKPYDASHPRAGLLRRKGLTLWIDHADAKAALGPGAVEAGLSEFKRIKPVFDWLMAH